MADLRLIKVPFSEKDKAKALGARWHHTSKSWYVPQGRDIKKFETYWSFLDCPYSQKEEVRSKGARWDRIAKKWFVPEEKDFEDFKKWWPSWIKNDEEIDSDEEEEAKVHEVTGQGGGEFLFYLDDNKESGGTAEVYFGWEAKELADLSDEEIEKVITGEEYSVAIKFFDSNEEDTQDLTMWEREVSALKKLSPHENIVQLIDYGFDKSDSTFFIVTKYCGKDFANLIYELPEFLNEEGENFDKSISDIWKKIRKMSAKKRWAALYEDLEQILDGLVHAFNNGILHRDLKPANVMVEITESKEDPKQVFKLIDFGLATKDEAFSENQLTLKGIGTHLYTPESTKEREESLETIDVYSWAVMAIEYLAIPYIKNGIQEFSNYPDLLRVFEDDIEPNYPKAVTKLLKRCVSLRPKNCPKNIIELKREIEEINKKLRSA